MRGAVQIRIDNDKSGEKSGLSCGRAWQAYGSKIMLQRDDRRSFSFLSWKRTCTGQERLTETEDEAAVVWSQNPIAKLQAKSKRKRKLCATTSDVRDQQVKSNRAIINSDAKRHSEMAGCLTTVRTYRRGRRVRTRRTVVAKIQVPFYFSLLRSS